MTRRLPFVSAIPVASVGPPAGPVDPLPFAATAATYIPRHGTCRDLEGTEVLVDGVKEATVDLYSSSGQPRQVVFSKEWATSGSHTLVMRLLGTKNASSSGTRVDIDAFVVIR